MPGRSIRTLGLGQSGGAGQLRAPLPCLLPVPGLALAGQAVSLDTKCLLLPAHSWGVGQVRHVYNT